MAMIYELRTYQLVFGGIPKYLDLVKNRLLPILAEHGLKPVGFWTSEIGPLNEVVHLWAFPDLNERQRAWGALAKDPRRMELAGELRQVTSARATRSCRRRTFRD
jgi:hypothetical protein